LKNPRQSYAHRGDRARRWARIKKVLLVLGFIGAAALLPRERPSEASASTAASGRTEDATQALREQLDAARGELDLTRAQLQRANTIIKYSARYDIGADLAASIYDVALAEGIDPELGFRLVNVESEFNPRAISSAGAIGLTQLMPATARYFKKGITREGLYDPTTNLRIGFRYLRSLISEYKGNIRLALVVYNRGPATVASLQARGVDPWNGYGLRVTKGYSGTGVIN
jgi:soluble lytic murein transglycosylase-like protein